MNDAIRIEPETSELSEQSEPSEALTQAIERGARALQEEQRPDGSWDADTDLGPSAAAMHFIVEAALGGVPASPLGPMGAGCTP